VRESTNAGLCGFGPGVIRLRLGVVVFAVASVFLGASASGAAAPTFKVTKLGGYHSYAIAINDSGQVAGNTTVVEPPYGEQRLHPFFWTRAGGLIDVGSDAGSDSVASAMNNKGEVVGSGRYHGSEQAFAWTRTGGRIALGSLPGVSDVPFPTAVSDSGQVVGRQGDHAFSWTPTGGMVDIGSLSEDGAGTAAEAVSNSGQVVGRSGPYAFSWTKAGGMVNLGALPGRSITAALAVNSKGQVVGYSGGGAVEHAFSWTSSGGMVDLGALPGGNGRSEATAINDKGQAVGFSSAEFGAGAFSWTAAGGMVDLGHLPGSNFTSAAAVNNAGQVVGSWGTMSNSRLLGGESHAFSWTAGDGLIPLPPLRGSDLGEWAVDVNSHGQVAGVSVLADNGLANQNAVIWSPKNQATSGNDTLTGTSGPNVICGLGGSDTIYGLRGNDTLFGDACGVKSKLASAAATGGNDVLNGGRGNDKLYGGPGNDKLNGGPGTNTYSGGPGNDTLNARNGEKETVDCGPGNKDVAIVDKKDKTKRCEKVKRAKK
jgi:probable HAF family extracellular repeat protein